MTKGAALQTFFNSFGIPAYPATAVPTYEDLVADGTIQDGESMFPYLTYSPVFDSWGNSVALTVNLWYRTEDEAPPNAKAQEMAEAIGGGKYILCDGGALLLSRGSPWCQSLTDSTDARIKRRYLNVTAEYLTLN